MASYCRGNAAHCPEAQIENNVWSQTQKQDWIRDLRLVQCHRGPNKWLDQVFRNLRCPLLGGARWIGGGIDYCHKEFSQAVYTEAIEVADA
jgi:hypothetical protein